MPNIERMLELNTRLEKNTARSPQKQGYAANKRDLDRLIENYDSMVYGPSQQTENKQQPYSAEAEVQRLKEIRENGGRREINIEGHNMPKEILESMINNPLDLNPDFSDPKMLALENRIAGKMSGIKKSVNVLKEVEKRDQEARQKLTEQVTHNNSSNSNIDYELIKTLIETALDKKLKEIKETLNESTVRTQNYVPSMKLMNFKDNFYFVDNDDNVFECQMVYKGKKKKK